MLEDPGLGSHWAAATRTRYQWAWGRYLTFLATTDQLSEEEISAERVTPERIAAYLEVLGDQVASGSTASYLEALHNTIFALAPDHDWDWLRQIVNHLKRRAVRARAIEPRLMPIDKIYGSALLFMNKADRTREMRPLQASVWYRDGLMVALLAASLLRRRNLAGLRVGIHLLRQSEGYLIVIPATEVKNRYPIEGILPAGLTAHLDRYLLHHRQRLLQSNESDALWISKDGSAMPIHAVGNRIPKITQRILGVPISAHLFRHAAATTIATDDPVHARVIRSLLVHTSHATGERYYNRAQMIDAARSYGTTLDGLRRSLAPLVDRPARRRGGRRCAR